MTIGRMEIARITVKIRQVILRDSEGKGFSLTKENGSVDLKLLFWGWAVLAVWRVKPWMGFQTRIRRGVEA
ncbi:MAG: hypothetical protein ACXQTQ_05505 [Candidatus Hecatellaceae archaeon]|nr:MAG: hypothetical protein DRO43_05375 [Candidatus Hecatellales archaeon]